MSNIAEDFIRFYQGLPDRLDLPEGISLMNPYKEPGTERIVAAFLRKYYNDGNPRIPMLGINPGRFGAGVTGVTFTDPVRLEKECGIPNNFDKRQELSSVFIYDFIAAWGGAEAFYSRFFLSAVFPLGFTREGRNLNYYDDPRLMGRLRDSLGEYLSEQLRLLGHPPAVVCLGGGKNLRTLRDLIERLRLNADIIPLPHPRWVMQYRYKNRQEYIREYLEAARISLRKAGYD